MSTNRPPLGAKAYHQRTKHHIGAYAKGPEGLDWEDQPDPFRRFAGCRQVALRLKARELATPFADLLVPGAVSPHPLNRDSLAIFCELAMGLSAWKVYGTAKWSLRCNPSSGNLHPTEAYLLLPAIDDEPAGLYHYVSHDHALEERCRADITTAIGEHGFLLDLSSIVWREAWKYGERAYRYCQLDVGHLLACVRYAAACLGWRVTLLEQWDDAAIASALGLDRDADYGSAEKEAADVMLAIHCAEGFAGGNPAAIHAALMQGAWQGRANILSQQHEYRWPILEQVEQACQRDGATANDDTTATPVASPLLGGEYLAALNAAEIIRRRRSAQAFDGTSTLPLSVFCRILDSLQPREGVPPLDLWPYRPRVHLVFFIHRVEGLKPGLYCLPRSREGKAILRQTMNPQFAWEAVAGVPKHIPLALLVQAKCGNAASTLSCHQPIAADSAFALAMLAEFQQPLAQAEWRYRHLFWEAGLLGQSLYLEAEAAKVRGTGIGCFFDDKVHEILGIEGDVLQDVYHFTLGTPQVDSRLVTLPPYSQLQARQS